MSWVVWLAMVPTAYFLWRMGFVATKQMRIDKNKEREEKAKKLNIKLPKV